MSKPDLFSLVCGVRNKNSAEAIRLLPSATSIDDFDRKDLGLVITMCGVSDGRDRQVLEAIIDLDTGHQLSTDTLMAAIESNDLELVTKVIAGVEHTDIDHISGCLSSIDVDDSLDYFDFHHNEDDPSEEISDELMDIYTTQEEILKLLLPKHNVSDDDLLDMLTEMHSEDRKDLFVILYPYVGHCTDKIDQLTQQKRVASWHAFVEEGKRLHTLKVLGETVDHELNSKPTSKPKKI